MAPVHAARLADETNSRFDDISVNSKIQTHANLLRLLTGALCALAVICFPASVTAAGLVGSFKARNVEIPVFLGNSMEPVATWKIDNVFTDHRRIGFFRVKLLPVLVAERVRLEFTQINAQTNWPGDFRFDLPPTTGGNAVEWRGFSIFFPKETVPRLRANRCHLAANAGPAVCRLEGVTLQVGSSSLNVPRAELRVEGPSAQVVWQDSRTIMRWDLFTGQCGAKPLEQETQK